MTNHDRYLRTLTTPEVTLRRDNLLAAAKATPERYHRAALLASAKRMTEELDRRFAATKGAAR